MTLVNLTKQTCELYTWDGSLVRLPPDPRHVGLVAVSEHRPLSDEAGHTFSLTVRTVVDVKGMPDPAPDTFYLVPVEVAMALQQRRDDIVFLAEDRSITPAITPAHGSARTVSHLRRLVLALPEPSLPAS